MPAKKKEILTTIKGNENKNFFGNLYCCLFTAGQISVLHLSELHDLV